MYYVNREQIERRLDIIPLLIEVCKEAEAATGYSGLRAFAEERALHLAIETVTDVGSLMIDGYVMRDASSYEDIIEILAGEQVFPSALTAPLIELVKLRRPLVQDYMDYPRKAPHPLTAELPALLTGFAAAVRDYLEREQ
ncbi:DUF86 domain-containing protein [Paenibacillus sp. y28]|uniref:DUF86 domain-containing protein n=1 Tax=Paenibacillus sp. y28 TaxID=3129110 RepID=UPI0030181753